MSESYIINKSIEFAAPADKVWALLTDPAQTKQYMFGCEVLSDWKIGSAVNWDGPNPAGEIIRYVKGEVLSITPGKEVTFTMFDPNMGLADVPTNYVTLTYQVEDLGSNARFTLIQVYPQAAEQAEKRYQESIAGWDMILPVMQKQVEGA